MPLFAKSLHFLASFMPVHFVVFMKGLELSSWMQSLLFGALVICGLAANLWVIYRFYRRADGFFVDVHSYQKSEENVLFYLLSIVPIFISADFSTIYSVIIFVTIYVSVVVVCFTSKYLFVNPILYFGGIRFYDAKISYMSKEREVVILSNRDRLRGDSRLRVSKLGSEGWYIASAN